MSDQASCSEDGEIERRVRVMFDDQMYPQSVSSLSPERCKIRALAVWPARALVPVIFIPGIMGSNLKNTKQDKPAWVPPNGFSEGWKELKARKKQEPDKRQEQLTADECDVLEVNEAVQIPDNYHGLDQKEAIRRHWGEVHADSYLEILKTLEQQLNYPYTDILYKCTPPKPDIPWRYAMSPRKQKWAPKSALSEAEFKGRMGEIYFPVYACGYNWLKSNEESAKRVVARVEEIEARIKDNCYYSYSGQVILVTHSMGGLVGRRAAQLLGKKVLGVVHGVQPVTGAPAVYRRFKAGTETDGFFDLAGAGAAVVLGWDAADVTCVLGNSPGPMELLPTKDYGAGWLQITDGDKTISLPEKDPYTEIYEVSAEDKWWGMVDPGLLDPAGKLKNIPKITPRDYFLKQLGKAQSFHDALGLYCHPHTYAYYGDDTGQPSLAKVVWRTTQDLTYVQNEDLLNAKRSQADLTGRTEVEIGGRRIGFSPDGKSDPGDGTVPTPSGEAAKRLEGIRDVFRLEGFDHQHSYLDEIAQHTVLYAIGKIAQDIKLKEDGTCEPS